MITTLFRQLPLLLLCGFATGLSAQNLLNNCEVDSLVIANLEGNGVRAAITPYGSLWFDGRNGRYQVDTSDVPGESAPTAIYAGGLWMGGRDPGGGLKVAASEYGLNNGRFDYYPGPLTPDGVEYADDCNDWNRVYPITRAEIDAYLDDPGAGVPENMASWPALGNPLFTDATGLVLPDFGYGYAPFWDQNTDGLYDPRDGDYPLFCGDQAIFAIFNDAGNVHRESGTPNQLQAEVHLLAYSVTDPSDTVLHRTTFYEYKTYNRSQEDLMDFYIGQWMDVDLGCATNDRFNSIPEENLFYFYNEGGSDPVLCEWPEAISYGNLAPATIIQVVRSGVTQFGAASPLSTVSYFNRGGATPAPPVTTDPSNAQEYYHRLRGLWRDGTPLYRSGNGYGQSAADITAFAFDGGPQPSGIPWKSCNVTTPVYDERVVYTTGPFPSIQPGASITFTTAVTTIFGLPYDGDCPDEAPIIAAANRVEDWYQTGCREAVLSNRPLPAAELGLEVFPNPATERVTFRLPVGEQISSLEIYDVAGRRVNSVRGGQERLDVSTAELGLREGMYLYRLTTASGKAASGKLVLR